MFRAMLVGAGCFVTIAPTMAVQVTLIAHLEEKDAMIFVRPSCKFFYVAQREVDAKNLMVTVDVVQAGLYEDFFVVKPVTMSAAHGHDPESGGRRAEQLPKPWLCCHTPD